MGAPGVRVICPDCHHSLVGDKCGHCSFAVRQVDGLPVYLSKSDFADSTFATYTENYETISQDDLQSSIQEESYLRTQTDKFVGYLGDVAGADVCEIGVGKGLLLSQLEKMPLKSLVGVDIATNYLKMLQGKVKAKLIIANAENLPFENQFDVIVSSDVLEHVLNVGDFMISVNHSLRMNGRVLIKVPYNENLLQYAQRLGCKYKFVHLRTFSQDSLKRIMTDSGFEPIRFHFDGYNPDRVRPWIKNHRVPAHIYYKRFLPAFASRSQVNTLPNWLGRLIIQPNEIVVEAIKRRNVL